MSDIDPFDPAGTPLGPRTEPLRSNPKITVETLPAQPINQLESGTIKAALAGLIISVLGLFGIAFNEAQKGALDNLLQLLIFVAPLIGTAITSIVAWRKRISSNQPIIGGAGDPQVMAQKIVGERIRGGKSR